jgi:hypothetical protein
MMQERIDVRLERAFWNALEAAVQPQMLAHWVSGSFLCRLQAFSPVMVASIALNCGQTPRYDRLKSAVKTNHDSRSIPAFYDGVSYNAYIAPIGYFLTISSSERKMCKLTTPRIHAKVVLFPAPFGPICCQPQPTQYDHSPTRDQTTYQGKCLA